MNGQWKTKPGNGKRIQRVVYSLNYQIPGNKSFILWFHILNLKCLAWKKLHLLYHLVTHYTCNGCVMSYGKQIKTEWQDARNIHIVINEDQEINLPFPQTYHNKHFVWEVDDPIWTIKSEKGWRMVPIYIFNILSPYSSSRFPSRYHI